MSGKSDYFCPAEKAMLQYIQRVPNRFINDFFISRATWKCDMCGKTNKLQFIIRRIKPEDRRKWVCLCKSCSRETKFGPMMNKHFPDVKRYRVWPSLFTVFSTVKGNYGPVRIPGWNDPKTASVDELKTDDITIIKCENEGHSIKKRKCISCEGRGSCFCCIILGIPEGQDSNSECPECNGSGKCVHCNGTGWEHTP